ncbi:DUF3500 domain-containing protein [Geodermatophilus sp. YIM 151500]|uniref:DUF3500 domain-containing protein n=1 Tax=Geodermatophilus sp. YIM 151500 TaxID=2984531 RepID=UPI0021E4C089|nr:DUF3500 domain-containing protein [Geodermatophilus sp. YIM 151500]MCV2489355.1 DUF3500 domain-containing protein [Geodermatophilus sp. YIM 151500]
MEDSPPDGRATQRIVADAMAAAATAWLDSLDAEQRSDARRPGPRDGPDAEVERRRWNYTPVDHGGLTLGRQRPAQQSLAMRLVATGLSAAGYATVCTVMGLETVLDGAEGFRERGRFERYRDPARYYLRVFGEPGTDAPWGWRLGGHHVSLNNLVVGGRVEAVTPCFVGANPAATALLGGASLRPLGATEDLARQLVRSLPPDLAARAVLLDRAPSDIVSRDRPRLPAGHEVLPASDGEERLALSARPRGLPARELDAEQRQLLGHLLGAYTGRVPDGLVPPVDLDTVHVAWAGSTEPGRPHYYRLHGPRLLVEWDNTQNGGNHAHSVWRDPQADFGADALAAHLAEDHAG